jgi:glutamate synthase domain-containing protein 1/glutamate synthase domain-containing protein 3
LRDIAESITRSRFKLPIATEAIDKSEAEGGCGVIGVASTVPIEGKYLLQSLVQMKNRGNGKGGGIAAVGLVPEQLGVTREVLEEDYLVQIAYLDPSVRGEVEEEFIKSNFMIDQTARVDAVGDHRSIKGLTVQPPLVYRYFCRIRPVILEEFINKHKMGGMERSAAEDEFVYQTSYRLNHRYYSSLGDKKAFVLSHGKDMLVLKLVGFGDDVVRYYKLEDFRAHIWVGHHRYPTKGRVWHPGGAHPFIGMHEALVHNGDFANYHSIVEYLAQRGIHPLFLTDTEVSVLLFDLWNRVYHYPLEFLVEAMAPTTERDFHMLPAEKRRLYGLVQATHIHGSPDGPWFFIIARNDPVSREKQLLGITDTSMLRPQVFALQDGPMKVGVIASERQAINAMLRRLSEDGKIPTRFADLYWNARGGSYTDGGTFVFTLKDAGADVKRLECTDKFGQEVAMPSGQYHQAISSQSGLRLSASVARQLQSLEHMRADRSSIFQYLNPILRDASFDYVVGLVEELVGFGSRGQEGFLFGIETLTMLYDRIYDTGEKRRASLLELYDDALTKMFASIPLLGGDHAGEFVRLDWGSRDRLSRPVNVSDLLAVDALDFPVDGADSVARFLVDCYQKGWRRLVVFNLRGHRFIANGLGPETGGLRLDCYGDVGDYVGSGVDGAEVIVHGAAQDQVAQIMKSGRLVVHGDVGQAFMYAAKGGDVYVLGNAAGRPLINAVGRPRVVINGTCLDYLAESFMAGDPYNGGGFVVVNGLKPTHRGGFVEQASPYHGGNLFSLASGGALYIRDPHGLVSRDQLNGGRLVEFAERDWSLLRPYLEENERLFGVNVERDLLTVGGEVLTPGRVYRKVEPVPLSELS